MIYDDCIHWRRYLNGNRSIWCQAFELLRRMTPNQPAGRETVLEGRLFANIFDNVGPASDSVLRVESHRKFIDIQTLLIGEEVMGYVPSDRLAPLEAYNAETDCEFFVPRPELLQFNRLTPGNFLIYFPGEGHTLFPTPELAGRPVKKVVVKIDLSLLELPDHHHCPPSA